VHETAVNMASGYKIYDAKQVDGNTSDEAKMTAFLAESTDWLRRMVSAEKMAMAQGTSTAGSGKIASGGSDRAAAARAERAANRGGGGRRGGGDWAQPPGGHMEIEKYCGPITWCIFVITGVGFCCCPCDSRQVYVTPNGQRIRDPNSSC
jgi:hypothetical protein